MHSITPESPSSLYNQYQKDIGQFTKSKFPIATLAYLIFYNIYSYQAVASQTVLASLSATSDMINNGVYVMDWITFVSDQTFSLIHKNNILVLSINKLV